jgi:lipopolysaccharide export system protein LptA
MEVLKKKSLLMNKFVPIIILFFIFIANIIASDGRLHLVHADKTSGKMVDNERIHIWKGSVHAYQDTVIMFCDSAVFFEDRDRAEFHGNVIIDDGHHKLWANFINYDTKLRIATCIGNVRISGIQDSLYADKFIYKFREKSADGYGNVFLWDKDEGSKLWGDNGSYLNEQKESHLNGNTKLLKPNENNLDTLIITAKKMDYFGIIPKKAIAIDSVRIFKNNLQAKCDSAIYSITEEVVFLRVNPFAWQEDNKMSGNYIDLVLDSLDLKQIMITGKSKIETLADSATNQFNLLRGKSIQVQIEDDNPIMIIARDNASSVFLIEEELEKQGTNAASSDSITIYFKEGSPDSINIAGGTEGTFYPPDHKGEFNSEH